MRFKFWISLFINLSRVTCQKYQVTKISGIITITIPSTFINIKCPVQFVDRAKYMFCSILLLTISVTYVNKNNIIDFLIRSIDDISDLSILHNYPVRCCPLKLF